MLLEVQQRIRRLQTVEDLHTITTVAEDAVLTYLQKPRAYDPARGSLMNWLVLMALSRLRNVQRSRRRRAAHEKAFGLDLSAFGIAELSAGRAESREHWITLHETVLLNAARTAQEHALVEARLAGADREAEAKLYGVDHLQPGEARAKINRVWENLVRRARRLWRRLGLEDEANT